MVQYSSSDQSTMSDKINVKNFILIIVFAAIFSLVVQDGIRLVIIKFYKIPNDSISYVRWGDTFFLHIITSLIATSAGSFVVGTFLKNRFRLAAVIATIPVMFVWIMEFVAKNTLVSELGYSFENVKEMLVLPAILASITPIVAYFSAGWGQEVFEEFRRPKSVLNIKWYNWLWILPFYLNKVIAIPLFTLFSLWKFDFLYDSYFMYDSVIIDIIFNSGYFIGRIIILTVLFALFSSVIHAYSLLSGEGESKKWKNALMIFGHVVLFSIIAILLFAQNYFQ